MVVHARVSFSISAVAAAAEDQRFAVAEAQLAHLGHEDGVVAAGYWAKGTHSKVARAPSKSGAPCSPVP
jgi:hypothetical protein